MEADLTELAQDAQVLLDEALPSLEASAPEPLDVEALAVLYGLPWTMGDARPAATDILVDAVARTGGDDGADLLRAVAALFPQATSAAERALAGMDADLGRRPGRPVALRCGLAWAANAGEAQVVAIVAELGDLAVPGYVILERDGGTVGGGLRDAPRPRADVEAQVEAFVDGLDGVTPLDPAGARERVRRLLITAGELELPQRESFALDRPLLAQALGDDVATWPVLPMVADEAVEGPSRPPSPRRGQDDRKRAKRRQVKAARRRNRR